MTIRSKLSWASIERACLRLAPVGTPRRKILQLLAIILLFEGISVLILFSYDAISYGVVSIAIGGLILVLFSPGMKSEEAQQRTPSRVQRKTPLGLVLLDAMRERVPLALFVIAGAVIVSVVVLFNSFISVRPEYGDLDTLSIMLGGMLMVYPFLSKRYRVETGFSVLFLGFVVLFLVIPQAVMSLSSGAGSSIGNRYVEYMLARPFSGILNLLGIHSSSTGNMVSLIFRDGTSTSLSISAYCAGMYSFSIFLAAFFSFVLVFERLENRRTVVVLALGVFIAYLGNLLRMVIIGVVGYYRGIDALLWAHRNVGWIIFLSWSAVFWYLLLGYISKHNAQRDDIDHIRAQEGGA